MNYFVNCKKNVTCHTFNFEEFQNAFNFSTKMLLYRDYTDIYIYSTTEHSDFFHLLFHFEKFSQ